MRLQLFCLLWAVVGFAFDASAEDLKVKIELDWSGYYSQEKLASSLQDAGRLPLPSILANNRLVGLVPATIEIPGEGTTKVDIGISQIAERPLYTITLIAKSGEVTAKSNVTELGIVSNYYTAPLGKDVDVLSFNSVVQTNPRVANENGVYRLSLPAAPYATLTSFVSSTDARLSPEVLDVVQYDGGKQYEPIAPILKEYKYDVGEVMNADIPSVYKAYLVPTWFEWANFIQVEDEGGILEADPRQRLFLTSVPTSAGIYIGGFSQSSTTDTTTNVARKLWRRIVIKMQGYQDCPVDPGKLTPPVNVGDPPAFSCQLKKL